MEEVYFLNKHDTSNELSSINSIILVGRPICWMNDMDNPWDGPLSPKKRVHFGHITVPVPTGEGYVLLRFEATPLRNTAQVISLVTLVFLLVGALWTQRARFLPRPLPLPA